MNRPDLEQMEARCSKATEGRPSREDICAACIDHCVSCNSAQALIASLESELSTDLPAVIAYARELERRAEVAEEAIRLLHTKEPHTEWIHWNGFGEPFVCCEQPPGRQEFLREPDFYALDYAIAESAAEGDES